ncbi:MAG: hypothetical protein FIB07_08590 [Candidatus Methanoperedens sp.]|nr:hypothetical protein [Candidatus Methanoperedens sp.]
MKDFEDALLIVACKNLESEANRFKDIDTKVLGIITITGILITFLMKSADSGKISTIIFLLTALSFLVTILFCVFTIKTRYTEAVSTSNLVNDIKNREKEHQLKGIIDTIAVSENTLRMAANSKAKDLRHAIYALGFSVFLLILYSLSVFFHF